MNRALWCGAIGLCISLTVACGGRSETENDDRDDFDIEESALVTERGCLTASGNRFVLTALEGGGGAQTELYQLIGDADELRQHVGKEVSITGDAEPARVAVVRESSAGSAGTSGTAQPNPPTEGAPQVSTQSQTTLQTRELRVNSVTPAGDCPEAATGAAQ